MLSLSTLSFLSNLLKSVSLSGDDPDLVATATALTQARDEVNQAFALAEAGVTIKPDSDSPAEPA